MVSYFKPAKEKNKTGVFTHLEGYSLPIDVKRIGDLIDCDLEALQLYVTFLALIIIHC